MDGALWITNNDGPTSIGRITTSGVYSGYVDTASIVPSELRRGLMGLFGSPTVIPTRSGESLLAVSSPATPIPA